MTQTPAAILATQSAPDTPQTLLARYRQVRQVTEQLCSPLETEDYVIQSMPDVSPTKWHLAHTTWFFETLLLGPHCAGYRVFDPQFAYLFNSYYLTLGERHCRAKRGLISRPTVAQVYEYRRYVDEQIQQWAPRWDAHQFEAVRSILELGINHEQQHQELLVTDIKHVFSENPLDPVYQKRGRRTSTAVPPVVWHEFPGGVEWIGYTGSGFAYDNESPRHRQYLEPFRLASRLVTNGEYRAFMQDGGYQHGTLWLSEGWATIQARKWEAPMYWVNRDGEWWTFTLSGFGPVDDSEPVCHISYYEADAYARWAGGRLPREGEWEVAAREILVQGNFVESGNFHPVPLGQAQDGDGMHQMFGDVWEWTQTPYIAYPGFKAAEGAVGEYNGKFMCNQLVLRGGSCATSVTHIRPTYRNFFPADARWQFMGIRLSGDVSK